MLTESYFLSSTLFFAWKHRNFACVHYCSLKRASGFTGLLQGGKGKGLGVSRTEVQSLDALHRCILYQSMSLLTTHFMRHTFPKCLGISWKISPWLQNNFCSLVAN